MWDKLPAARVEATGPHVFVCGFAEMDILKLKIL